MMPTSQQRESMERTRFLLRNLVRGLVWLAVIVGGYFYAKNHFDFSLENVLGPVYDRPMVIFLIFLLSEVVFGIIPPELFMIWALKWDNLAIYMGNILALATISYLAGILAYNIGKYFNTTRLYRIIRVSYLRRFEKYISRFGGFLVTVAALTPLPFAGICMLMGAIKYPLRRFLIIALIRFLRFGLYAYVVWEANILQ